MIKKRLENFDKFSNRVYDIIRKIFRGRVSTYQEVARALGHPKAARAVGQALRNNPWPKEIPCHRIVKSDGSLGGYQAGSLKKKRLLEQEGIKIRRNKIINFKDKLFKF